MIKVDKEKIEQVILNEMSELENSPFISGEVCIFQDESIQVSIKTTKDESEFFDSINPDCECINDISDIKPHKPFDISEHKFNDINISMSGKTITVKYEQWGGHLDGYRDEELDVTLNKADAIAIAKALGVTGEDLK